MSKEDDEFYARFKIMRISLPSKRLEIGSRVLVTGDHPWSGHTGVILAVEMLKPLNKPGVLVRLDNGHECFVLTPGEMRAV